jgi:mono/diheme cytochrome c family protein
MKLNRHTLLFTCLGLAIGSILISSCKRDALSPGYEYMPDMYRGPALEAYGTSPVYQDGMASRKPVAGTVPRYNAETLPYFAAYPFPNTNEGYELAGASLKNPLSINTDVLAKGEAVYKNFCIHCHGEKGDGVGILVQRDKFAGVPSYFGATIANLEVGKMYHTIYYGKNMMGSHASQINYEERWQVISWVEKLRADGLGVSIAPASSDSSSIIPAVTPAVK